MSISSEGNLLDKSWKWRFRLTLGTATIILLLDGIAISLGFSLQNTLDLATVFEWLVLYVNLTGVFTVVILGDPLANPMDHLAHQWNLFVFMIGGLATWVLVALLIGWLIDWRCDVKNSQT